jgi:hypothetical protein
MAHGTAAGLVTPTMDAEELLLLLSRAYHAGLSLCVRLQGIGLRASLDVSVPSYRNHPSPRFELYVELHDKQEYLAVLAVEITRDEQGWLWAQSLAVADPDHRTVWDVTESGLDGQALSERVEAFAMTDPGQFIDAMILPHLDWRPPGCPGSATASPVGEA